MRFEIYQVFAFLFLSLGFTSLSIFYLMKYYYKLHGLRKNKPCSTYLKMRLQIIKIYNEGIADGECMTRFGKIKNILR